MLVTCVAAIDKASRTSSVPHLPFLPKREALRTGFIDILELLLRSSPKRNFIQAGAHTVMTLEGIFHAFRFDGLAIKASGGGLPNLESWESGVKDVLGGLVANFPLWVRAPPEFQFGLATCVLEIFRDTPELFCKVVSLESILLSICICCPDEYVVDSERTLDKGVGSVSGCGDFESRTVPFTKRPTTTSPLTKRERLHMRGYLWQVARLLLERGINQEDGDALAQFVATCDDQQLVRP